MNSAISGTARPADLDLEPLLNQINVALKCLQLYPAEHTTTKSAIDKLRHLLAEHFKRREHLDLVVKRDGISIRGQRVGSTSPGLRSLALQLYRLRIDCLSIRPEIDHEQLVALLMIACMNPEDVFKAGGVKELLWQKRVNAVAVSQASIKLDHAAAPGSADSTDIGPRPELTAYNAILSEEALSEPERHIIKRHLELGPEQLSGFIETLSDTAEEAGGISLVLENALPKLDSVIKLELADDQASLYSNLGETLSFLREPVREGIAALLDQDAGRRAVPGKAIKASPIEDVDAAALAARATATDQEGFERIEQEITAMTEALIEEGALDSLSEVLAVETDGSRLTSAVKAIQRILNKAIDRQRFDVAGAALAGILNELKKRVNEPDTYPVLKEAVRDAGAPGKIESLFCRLESMSNPAIGQAADYLTLTGNTGVLTLLDMLAVEKRQSRRLLLCQVLTACGRANIAGLGDKIMDHRWYLVRNVVYILGQIGDEKAALYLQKSASHPDARVRMEVAKALPNIGAPALPVVLGLLRDKDLDIQLEAIRALANINHPSVFDVLIDLVEHRDFFRRRVDLKIEAIRALGRLSAERSVKCLNKIAGSKAWLFKTQQARLAWAAGNALIHIRGGRNGG